MSKKRIIFLFLVFGLFSLLLVSCGQKEIKNVNSRGETIICFGDSITFGTGVRPGASYPDELRRMIGVPVINAGIDSETTPEALKRLEADVLDRRPLLVIVEFGGNDFLQRIPPEVTFANVRAIVDRIQAAGAMVAIVDIGVGLFLEQYRAGFYRIAQEKNAVFIPGIFNGIMINDSLKSDILHPNSTGYRIIGHRIYRAIVPYLNQNAIIRKFTR